MADLWVANGVQLYTNTLGTSTAWFYLSNGSDATRVLRLSRVMLLNNQLTAVTGVLATLEFRKYTGSPSFSGTLVTPVSFDTNNTALEAAVTAGWDATVTGGTPSTMRRWVWSTDEPTVGTMDLDMFETVPMFCNFFDSGLEDSTVQPLVLRAGEAAAVYCTAATSTLAGQIDIVFEFTNEAS